jgi:[phosphatase 2A protein]-leucine-carboxy methyltransferase
MTTSKAMAIRKSKDLSSALGDMSQIRIADGGTALHSQRYHLVGVDLRGSPEDKLTEKLAPILNRDLPTVLLFECVLVYMAPEASQVLIKWFLDYFKASNTLLGGIVYEMFGLGDNFGRVLINNLKVRLLLLSQILGTETGTVRYAILLYQVLLHIQRKPAYQRVFCHWASQLPRQ